LQPLVLYHNPGCSKSRGALDLLRERGVELEIVEYLDVPLSAGDLQRIIAAIPESAAELVRHDKNFKELGLDPEAYGTAESVVALLLEHPKLMQRPIVLRGDRGVIGRPPEKLLELL
jgi:arsenate reductase